MTTEERLRSLLSAATPGPWRFPVGGAITDTTGDSVVFGEYRQADATLIVEAVNALPRLLAALSLGRQITEYRPSATFDFLDPRGEDLLIGIAAWMDKIDERDGNSNHDVQRDLRAWAITFQEFRAALRKLDAEP